MKANDIAAARRAVEAARAGVAGDPLGHAARHDLANALDHAGDALAAQGDLDAALACYRENLHIRRKTGAGGPGPGALTIVEKIGKALVLKSAMAAHLTGGDAARRDPGWSLASAGDALAARGDMANALALYREGLAQRRALLAAEPGNAGLARDVAWRLRTIGDALAAQGDHDGALTAHREALAIRRTLVAQEPANGGAIGDLAWSLGAVGAVLEAQGDRDGALAAYRECLDLRHTLAAADPDNAGLREDIAVTEARIAAVQG
jgi:tetratricopeptide (TPR) repeat protein